MQYYQFHCLPVNLGWDLLASPSNVVCRAYSGWKPLRCSRRFNFFLLQFNFKCSAIICSIFWVWRLLRCLHSGSILRGRANLPRGELSLVTDTLRETRAFYFFHKNENYIFVNTRFCGEFVLRGIRPLRRRD